MAIGRSERFLRAVVALALLPLCVAATLVCSDMLRAAAVSDSFILPGAALLGGCLLWALIYMFMPRPLRAYILAHELTHALWGVLFGARVSDLRVRAAGGSVRLSKTNTLITLAPYFFPFYTMLLIAIWSIVALFINLAPWSALFLFLIGATWCFHLTFTINSLFIHQPDISECGRLFSYTLIYLLNVAGVAIWIVCANPIADTTLVDAAITRTCAAYSGTFQAARQIYYFCRGR